MHWLANNWFKVGVLLFMFAAFWLLHEIFIVSPVQQEIARQIAEARNRDKLQMCLAEAETSYSAMFASLCNSQAETLRSGYTNCINQPYMDRATCASVWGNPSEIDASSSCTLTGGFASQIKEYRSREEDKCYRMYGP